MKSRFKSASLGAIAAIALLLILTVMMIRLSGTGTKTSAFQTATLNESASLFEFEPTLGWHQGVTDKMSTVLFDDDAVHACFIAVEYKPGTVDVVAELSRLRSQIESSSPGRTVKDLPLFKMTLRTERGQVAYELHRSAVVSAPGADKVKEGHAFGYAQLEDGFVAIEGSCDQPEQLTTLAPPLRALTINLHR